MASSSSSFSSEPWKYHVFLSFRGEDTRKTFVDHLYSTLDQQGIYTYKDDETLPRGESIGPSLKKAIEQSQIAIIVFSKNYANSSWCLDELVHIMECKVNRGQTVMPIFYDVDPSALRKQKQEYGEAFAKYELENNTKVESWRKALVDASNISGWEPKHIANGHEAKVIKEIVGVISHRVHPQASTVNENLVGIEACLQDLISKLQIGSGGVRMIGIWGVGGSGKTTLASCIYEKVSKKFDGCSFVNNIRVEASRIGVEASRTGLKKLQEQILADVLKEKGMVGNKVEEGRGLTNNRLHHINVLLVLDDVDHLDHLRALAGSHDWFGEGSRIIITTRDQHLLTAHKVNVIHNISLLNNDEAIKLFRKLAPRGNRPMEDYELLSKDVVSYAGGLPLALKVLGCFLCDKDIDEWRSTLARLQEIPEAEIVEKLKISYDGLKPVEKDLFLHIACFYRGCHKTEETMAMLNALGFYPVIGIKVLIQKALITISKYGVFEMHDLVQEMGHHIVRGEHPNNPEKHSRVWKGEDVLKICAMDATKELDMIKAIKIYWNGDDQVPHLSSVVAKMKNLRWMECRDNNLSPFPTNFPPVELCCLTLSGTSLKQLWKGCKHLPNLKIMELSFLDKLIMTPDFRGLPNLERFKLTHCWNLKEIHPSIGCLKKLVFLSVENSSLEFFPPITQLKELETRSFLRCTKLLKLSKIQQRKMKISGHLPKLHLPNLKSMELSHLDKLIMTPDFHGLPNLERIKLTYCWNLKEIHPSIGCLEKLVFLSVENSSLKMFPPITQLKELETRSKIQQRKMKISGHHLDNSGKEVASYQISRTNSFVTCWMCGYNNLHGDTQVEKPREDLIDVECCLKEPCLPHMKGLPFFNTGLRKLYLQDCSVGDEHIGSAAWELPNLQELDLEGNNFSRLDFRYLRLPRLKWLDVSRCKKLVELSQLPPSIAVVNADCCESLRSFGDISNCKWLWKVFLLGENKLGPLGQELLLHSMLQGNAIEDHAINIGLQDQMVPKEFVGRMFRGETCTLHLPHDWYTEFCGFLICIVSDIIPRNINIIIKHERYEDSGFEVLQECNEALEPKYDEKYTFVGYVSFGSLRHQALSNSSYNMISFSLENMSRGFSAAESYVGAVLMPRKSKGHQVQTTTDCSEFYANERKDVNTFKIQHVSQSSSIKILWKPCYHSEKYSFMQRCF